MHKKFNPDIDRMKKDQSYANAWLAEELEVQKSWLESLGWIGRNFIKAFEKTGCAEEIGKFDEQTPAAYCPNFGVIEEHGNFIRYSTVVLRSREAFFNTRIHEIMHAIQYQSLPHLYCHPLNDRTNIIFSPKDLLHLNELIEMSAYAIAEYFSYLAWKNGLGNKDFFGDVCFKIFDEYQINDALMLSGQAEMISLQDAKEGKFDDPGNQRNMRASEAAHHYLRGLSLRFDQNEEVFFTIVRLTSNDVLEIGTVFGPNSFGSDNVSIDQIFGTLLALSKDNQVKLRDLFLSFGIADPDSEKFPTLREALKDEGLTKRQFLEQQRAGSTGQSGAIVAPPSPLG